MTRTFGHFPFGETWYETGTPDKWKFTSYERDTATGETGLDYAVFRQYAPGQGRFINADLLSGSVNAPQSLIRYSYTMDDPINALDPFGLCTGFIGRDKNGEPIFGTVPCHKPQDGDDGDGGGSTGGGGGGGGAGGCGGPCGGGSGGGGGGSGPKKPKQDSDACKKAKEELAKIDAENSAEGKRELKEQATETLIAGGIGCVVGALDTEAAAIGAGAELGGPVGAAAGAIAGTPPAVGNCVATGVAFAVTAAVVWDFSHLSDLGNGLVGVGKEAVAAANVVAACY